MRGGLRFPPARTLLVGVVPDSGFGIRLHVGPGSLSAALPSKWPDCHCAVFAGELPGLPGGAIGV